MIILNFYFLGSKNYRVSKFYFEIEKKSSWTRKITFSRPDLPGSACLHILSDFRYIFRKRFLSYFVQTPFWDWHIPWGSESHFGLILSSFSESQPKTLKFWIFGVFANNLAENVETLCSGKWNNLKWIIPTLVFRYCHYDTLLSFPTAKKQ